MSRSNKNRANKRQNKSVKNRRSRRGGAVITVKDINGKDVKCVDPSSGVFSLERLFGLRKNCADVEKMPEPEPTEEELVEETVPQPMEETAAPQPEDELLKEKEINTVDATGSVMPAVPPTGAIPRGGRRSRRRRRQARKSKKFSNKKRQAKKKCMY